ncbi:MAG: aldehyde dehydrogenase (NADP(+)) [bacterium]|nr:aldehyde dehydrogenase (NADP(+)) [bacterium]
MRLLGEQLIGLEQSGEGSNRFWAEDPVSGATLEPAFLDATADEIDRALRLAVLAKVELRRLGRKDRAHLLDHIADRIESLGGDLLERTRQETGLPLARLEGERARTCNQLRLFGEVVRQGRYLDARIDTANPTRAPLAKPDVRQIQAPIGPVVVFGASNFPFAFSAAGGDTAAAIAAGCPVIVKAHPNHPGASEMVGRAIIAAVEACGFPEGTFSLVHGAGHEVGVALVRHPSTRAVGFTGSFAGGTALLDAAMTRDRPIPVFAEMGSVNPTIIMPGALAERSEDIVNGLAASVTLGVGQFCTNPGLILLLASEETTTFIDRLADTITDVDPGPMLHSGICNSYYKGLSKLAATPGVRLRAGKLDAPDTTCTGHPALLEATAMDFLDHPWLAEEVFGPSTLAIICGNEFELYDVIQLLGGQLTGTVHAIASDLDHYGEVLPLLEERVGRLVFGGFPTGVEVCHAMHHGGPFPATTDGRFTSVGSASIRRFLRPVCYQDWPQELLPEELRDDSPAPVPRMIDGEFVDP